MALSSTVGPADRNEPFTVTFPKILKFILDFFKPVVVQHVNELKTNRDANIATVEALVGSGEHTAEGAIVAFVAKRFNSGPLTFVVSNTEPLLMAELASLVQQGQSIVPALYDAAVAFLEKEEAYL